MAATKLSILNTSMLLCLLMVICIGDSEKGNMDGGIYMMDCGSACKGRCQLSSRLKMCLRACGTCCERCNCVPPGTSGNADVCPCYAQMTTHGGRLKCP